eukprot:scaffold26868_cov29-Attheya_sp.AAC.1
MRLVLAVGTLVFLLQSEVSFQSCPPFCAESVELMSIEISSIDASHSCGSIPGRLFGIRWLVVEISSHKHCLALSLLPPCCVLGHAMSFGCFFPS